MEFVTVGNAGNIADTTGYGAVGYNYRIDKYEVTNAQWNTFVSLAGAPTGNPSNAYDSSSPFTGDQKPTTNVSLCEAAQFCNYLTSGDKSLGAYQLGTDGSVTTDRAAAVSAYGTAYVIPTPDEWYKAAYHKNDGVTGNYWLYPTQLDVAPSNILSDPDPSNSANFYIIGSGYTVGSPDYVTDVGAFENSDSAYGTFDQGGNVWEWTETVYFESYYYIRGGSYGSVAAGLCASYSNNYYVLYNELDGLGFRVVAIPEPASAAIMTLAGLFIALKRRKR
ncbi:MAG: hypothetical protein A2173_00580 [Planctomycetes bacterium RBG_13_44_8b]|nr:MAG: hypothetical protein A2173_00580 [Planctomycetes bacterium RBG_13_44_8b]